MKGQEQSTNWLASSRVPDSDVLITVDLHASMLVV